MLRELALPGIGDVDESVGRLDDRRITELGLGFVLEDQRGFPSDAVLAEGEIQRAASLRGVIIDQQVATILQGDRVGPGVRIREVGQGHL
jgi:hypothetical protein